MKNVNGSACDLKPKIRGSNLISMQMKSISWHASTNGLIQSTAFSGGTVMSNLNLYMAFWNAEVSLSFYPAVTLHRSSQIQNFSWYHLISSLQLILINCWRSVSSALTNVSSHSRSLECNELLVSARVLYTSSVKSSSVCERGFISGSTPTQQQKKNLKCGKILFNNNSEHLYGN